MNATLLLKKKPRLKSPISRHDVTNATRELIKDSTQDLKSLSLHQSLDSKKSVSV